MTCVKYWWKSLTWQGSDSVTTKIRINITMYAYVCVNNCMGVEILWMYIIVECEFKDKDKLMWRMCWQ